MDQLKSIKRTYYCNLHSKPVEHICIDAETLRPLLCKECLEDPDIHDPKFKNIVSIDIFFYQIEQAKREEKDKGFTRAMPKDIETLLKNREDVNEFYNNLISDVTLFCHKEKERAFKLIDEQIELFKHNYSLFIKGTETLYPKMRVEDNFDSDPFEEANESIKFADFEELVNKYHEKYFVREKIRDNKIGNKKKSLKNCGLQIENSIKSSPIMNTDKSTYRVVLQNIERQSKEVIEKNVIFKNPIHEVDFFLTTIDSNIINTEQEHNLLKSFMGNLYRYPRFELIYRASKHGYTCDDFHRECTKQGPTIVLCRNEHGKRFGGYAQYDWVADDLYAKSANNFLFSVDLGEKYSIKQNSQDTAMKTSKNSGPVFGAGDLRLSSHFKNKNSTGKIGVSYYNYNSNLNYN
eukprot:CAMPEP_0114600320 /NCGR_PEP_ID=MMETSP0125-20121206/22889_1 /TAXON_ID=485358 ORGANISM="Aristerostoma sp., Strain ATCC 50986" /NCGR_SAMPLE_ID=MMETSP0125 /ASSEMBLY_ACC=CAM_ASM_000245 /LENGTH=405 /DNA_ID=CAMNT_0001808331 /DNA_START=41 /DNA_END=1259 /DNA_ORIENTATION=+